MCLIVDQNKNGIDRCPLINSQVRLKTTVHLPDRILPCGSVYTIKMSESGFAYIEDTEGLPIFNYYNISNFQHIN